jgi:hypothetical protein
MTKKFLTQALSWAFEGEGNDAYDKAYEEAYDRALRRILGEQGYKRMEEEYERMRKANRQREDAYRKADQEAQEAGHAAGRAFWERVTEEYGLTEEECRYEEALAAQKTKAERAMRVLSGSSAGVGPPAFPRSPRAPQT